MAAADITAHDLCGISTFGSANKQLRTFRFFDPANEPTASRQCHSQADSYTPETNGTTNACIVHDGMTVASARKDIDGTRQKS